MTTPSEPRRQAEAIYRAALGRAPAERVAYVAELCAGDTALMREVRSMLERRSEPGGGLGSHAADVADTVILTSPATPLAAGERQGVTDGNGVLESWGPFRILERIGQGSFGEVYRAFDTMLEREVALKLLLPRGSDQESERRDVLREARAMARVRHPNVVPVYGVDTHDGRVGFWSDFVRGRTLSALLDAQGPFGAREVSNIGVDLCRAVGAVHAAGLLHRDIKAGNAMREEGGRILLMDFGLSHATDRAQGVAGTPAYMAPELFDGRPASVSSDVYALGVLLFQLLTGKFPVDGSVLGMRDAHQTGVRRALLDLRPDLPEQLARVVEAAIHPDPAKRYASAGQLIAALSEAAGVSGGSRDLVAVVTPPARRFRPWMLAPVAAVAVGLLIPQVRRVVLPSNSSSVPPATVRDDYRRARDLVDRYYQLNAIETAIPLLTAVVQKDAAYAPAWADLGRANFLQFWQLRETKYVEPARAASFQALALNPNLASAHVTLGMLYTETGQHDLSAQELTDALGLDSRNAEAYSALAELYYRQGRVADVEPTFRKSIDLDPGNWRLFNEFGYYFIRTGKFDLAADQYTRAVALTPDNPRALNNLGICYWRLNRLQEASDAFERAIQLEPSANRYVNLGRVLAEDKRFSEAIERYKQGITLDPGSYFAWGELATAYKRTGDSTQSRAAYLKALSFAEELRKARPKDPLLLADLGLYYAYVGDETNGVTVSNQAAALAPENPSVLQEVATALEILHHRDEALARLRQAIAMGRPRAIIEREPDLTSLRTDERYSALFRSGAVPSPPEKYP